MTEEISTDPPVNLITESAITETPIVPNKEIATEVKEDRKNNPGFSIPIIIAAALIFIVIIAWFESLRIWLEFAFNPSTVGLFNKALADMVYAICATTIVIVLIFLIMKFWIKNI